MKRLLLFSLVASFPLLASRREDVAKRIDIASQDLKDVMHAKDKGIPEDLMEKAHCIGIIPGMKRAGFVFGADYGKGLVTCRIAGTNHWSAPSMVIMQGGSFGLQIGAGETDVVFAVMNASGERRLREDKFTIGAEASAMAGPIGRNIQAETDAMMRAEILSWSRARGVFAGVDLNGASLRPDNDDNRTLYGKEVGQDQILHDEGVKPPPEAAPLYAELERYARREPKTGGF